MISIRVERKSIKDLDGNYDSGVIELDDLPEDVLFETFVHESLHMLCHLGGIQGPMFNNCEEAEERAVRMLTPHLVSFLRANPDFLRWALALSRQV